MPETIDILKDLLRELHDARCGKAAADDEYKPRKQEFDAQYGELASLSRALSKKAKELENTIRLQALAEFEADVDHVKRIANAVSIVELSSPAPVYDPALALEWAQSESRYDLMEYQFTMTKDMAAKVFGFLAENILHGEVAMSPRLNVAAYERVLLNDKSEDMPGEVQTHQAKIDSNLQGFMLAESGADVLEALTNAPSPLPEEESSDTVEKQAEAVEHVAV